MKPSLICSLFHFLFALAPLPGTLALAAEAPAPAPEKREVPPPLVVTRSAADLTAEGDSALKAGKPALAIQSYRQALALSPSLHDVRLRLAQVLERQGQKAESLLEFERLNREHPAPATTLALVQARLEAGALVDAALLARKALEAQPGDEKLSLLQGDILLRLKDPAGALAVLDKCPPSPKATLLRARAHEALAQWGEAYALYQPLAVGTPNTELTKAAQRMRSHALKLADLLIFPPEGWEALAGAPALRQHLTGIQVAVERAASVAVEVAAKAAIETRLPEGLRQALPSDVREALAAKLAEHKSGAPGHHQDVSLKDLDTTVAALSEPPVGVAVEPLGSAALACSRVSPAAQGMALPPPACALAIPGAGLVFVLSGSEPGPARERLAPLSRTKIIRE